MKNKLKYAFVFSTVLVIGIISINLFQPNKEQQVKGSIELLVSENSYDYLVTCANKFMKLNDKITINIKKMDDYSQIKEAVNKSDKEKPANIGQIDRCSFEKLEINDSKYNNDETELLNTYSKNFAKYRVDQVKSDGKSFGIPLNSRPLGFYVREDMLKQYGYKRDSMNTWNDIIEIGKDIYQKSNGTVRIINGTGQDYKDLLELLIMENLNSGKSEEEVKSQVESMIKELKDNNILNLQEDGEFLARIASINGMKEIMALDVPCEWSIDNVPSIQPGANKFFATEGDNLVILNENSDNQKLIEKFITYVITNNEEAIKYVKGGEFFSSYLYTYKEKEIEQPVKNFVGKSPLVVLSNVEEKALGIDDYDKYIKVKKELMS
ncbi:ABC transporter substrate-binding protein [Clostridium saccharobutylicum]|uniref:Lactose-binding protein n=1 Tax=Clostridium saccharobutylicum TaxID=169679 RepID=A0A1S8N6G6_CLOSA|nr:ABC transporter substrate-binding protein [Clostridium saccharobutylicum]OOM12037.1 lactose-binding protein precursor [Clostridium saccharobutylicum]